MRERTWVGYGPIEPLGSESFHNLYRLVILSESWSSAKRVCCFDRPTANPPRCQWPDLELKRRTFFRSHEPFDRSPFSQAGHGVSEQRRPGLCKVRNRKMIKGRIRSGYLQVPAIRSDVKFSLYFRAQMGMLRLGKSLTMVTVPGHVFLPPISSNFSPPFWFLSGDGRYYPPPGADSGD